MRKLEIVQMSITSKTSKHIVEYFTKEWHIAMRIKDYSYWSYVSIYMNLKSSILCEEDKS